MRLERSAFCAQSACRLTQWPDQGTFGRTRDLQTQRLFSMIQEFWQSSEAVGLSRVSKMLRQLTRQISAHYPSSKRPVSNVVLLPCQAGSTAARLHHNTGTTWFQTSNLIQSYRTAVAENKTQKYRNGLANFYMYSNVFIIYELSSARRKHDV